MLKNNILCDQKATVILKKTHKTIKKRINTSLSLGILASAMILGGCQTPAIYYEDWYNPPVYWGQHTVREGETLYKIAWRYGRDYRELGDANGLEPPYLIETGQKIRLDLKGDIAASGDSAKEKASSGVVIYADDPETQETVAISGQPDTRPKTASKVPNVAKNLTWRSPHDGKIIKSFSSNGMRYKGVDIAGSKGDPIKAAAKGHVMYAGSGILGYGNMIILGHDAKTFSVYAHNESISVSEGDTVEAGETIAKMGDSGADRVKLYFEVRKNGKAVNPLPYIQKNDRK